MTNLVDMTIIAYFNHFKFDTKVLIVRFPSQEVLKTSFFYCKNRNLSIKISFSFSIALISLFDCFFNRLYDY